MKHSAFQKYLRVTNLIFFLVCAQFVVGQTKTIPIIIDWKCTDITVIENSNDLQKEILSLNNAIFFQRDEQALPWQQLDIQRTEKTEIDILSIELTQADTIDLVILNDFDPGKISNDFDTKQLCARNSMHTYIQPLKIENNKLIRFISGSLTYTETPISKVQNENTQYEYESVLATGEWYKLGVTQKGIYKITYQDLENFGINVSTVNPLNISIFGNGGAMLPEANKTYYPDDLVENAIFISGENDRKFDEEDYILFYGEDPIEWIYDPETLQYNHNTNIYSDTVYYFLRIDNPVSGKRIQNVPFIQENAINIKTDFHDYLLYKKEEESIAPFGRIWVGDMLSTVELTEKELLMQVSGLIKSCKIKTTIKTVGYTSKKPLYWSAFANETALADPVSIGTSDSHTYGILSTDTASFISDSENIKFKIKIDSQSEAKLWISYIQLNFKKALQYRDQSLFFRLSPNELSNKLTQVEISDCHRDMFIWDISDPKNISSNDFKLSGNKAIFKERFTGQKEYIAFEDNTTLSIPSVQKIENQNLHRFENADMIIICPKQWMEQGEELASLHQQLDNLNSIVVNIDEIYNEFGNGTCDPSSIRNFVRMVYTRSNTNLKYLLLFGSTSFDFRDKLGYNNNIISSYQSKQSLNEVKSYVTDDYFALMDLQEGSECRGIIDIGVGRLPVTSKQQAIDVVNKIKHYCLSSQTLGQWRNNFLLMADDQDGNEYINQSEKVSIQIDTITSLNINKLYIDAFEQIRVSEGDRYPNAKRSLMQKFDEGILIFNYIGHGGVLGITDEKVFTSSDAMTLKNFDRLPFMFSATCEMARFDDPSIVSLGEQLILNKDGGAIALYTTTRPVNAAPALTLLQKFYQHLMKSGENILSIGEAFRLSKSAGNSSHLCYPIIGDPALKIAYPQKRIKCTYINTQENDGIPPFETQIVVNAMGNLFVEGYITDTQGNLDENFNGYIIPKFFDKKSVYHTLANDANSFVAEFQQFDDILHNGKASVVNGKFNFMFKLPLDIRYHIDYGKLSLYAYDTVTFQDATGSFNNIFVGGISPVAIDNQGPDITLYWNDPNFVSGQIVDNKGTLLAKFYDPQGIYHCSNSIGRDITLTHNGKSNYSRILNHLFEPKADDFSRGSLKIDFDKLENGEHRLSLKAWDLHNNPSEKEIWFVVEKTHSDAISRVLNYPNPFRENTTFSFDNNDFETVFDVLIDIYDVYGKHIVQLKGEKHPNSKDILQWDGKDAYGNILSTGTYIYHMTVSNQKGMQKVFNQRLVYIR